MFDRLNDILTKINHEYAMTDSTKKVLSDYVKTQNNQKAFNDLLAKVVSKIGELKEYGNIQHFIKYPIENEGIEKLLSEIYSKYLEIEGLLSADIIIKLNHSDSKILEQYKNDFKEYKEIIQKEEDAINNYNNGINIIERILSVIFLNINSKEEGDVNLYVPLTLESYNEYLEVVNMFDNISIPKELEYRVNFKKYESFIEDIAFLKSILALNDKCVIELESKCISLQTDYINELYKITKNKNGIACAHIPLTGEDEIFAKYSSDFNFLFSTNKELKEYEKIMCHIEFWEKETSIFNNEIKKKNEEFNLKEKVQKIQRSCLDCAMKVIEGLRVSQIEDSLSNIKLPFTEAYIEEFNACFKEYNSMDSRMRKEASSERFINANFLFLDAFIKKVDDIISSHEKILFFFKKESALRELCQADIIAQKPSGNYDYALNEIMYYYNEIKHLKNIYVENALANLNDVYKRACKRLESYREYKINRSIKRESFCFVLLIGLFILITIASLAAYSYWGAVFLRSGIMNPFPQWFYKIANIDWFHHWANWGGNVWPVINLFVWAFEGLWVAITWLIWAIVWLLLMILCGLAYVICYVLVPAAAGMIVGGIFIGLNKIRTKDDDSVVMVVICVLTVLAFIALYILCFTL